MGRRSRALGVAVCLVVAATGASATPGSGVTSTSLGRGRAPDGIALSARGATEVTMSEITIAPGGSTGWHYHDGQVLAIVKSGTLTRTLADCSTEVTRAGGSFVEPAGSQSPHVGRNLGTEPVVLLVAYVVPAGDPLARDVADARCGL